MRELYNLQVTRKWNVQLNPHKKVCFLFSDRGTPVGYRYLNGYGSHTFKMVNAQGEPNYVKFHYKTEQGIKCFDRHQADEMAKQARIQDTKALFSYQIEFAQSVA